MRFGKGLACVGPSGRRNLPTIKVYQPMAGINVNTVRLGKMAQHARHWALFMAKLKGQSQNASNMALGKCIGLQHIQISAS